MNNVLNQKDSWEVLHSKIEWGSGPVMEFLAFMADYYWGKEDLEFLDLGAGTGSSTLWLASKGFKVTAVEISKVACDKLWNNLPESSRPLVKIINGDVTSIDLDNYAFDGVIGIGILECLGLEQSCLLTEKIKGWVKPDGHILMKILAKELAGHLSHKEIDMYIYTEAEVTKMFENYNRTFRVDTRYVGHGFIPVHTWTVYARGNEFLRSK